MKKNNESLNALLNNPVTAMEKFHKKTNINTISKDLLNARSFPIEWTKIYYKGYSRLKEIILPKPDLLSNKSLKETLEMRESKREFSKIPLPSRTLSSLLYYSSGLNNHINEVRRFYPSAGARYPLETYIIALNVKGLDRGLYHYYIKNHSLEQLLLPKEIAYEKLFSQDWILHSPCIFLITANFKRSTLKYGDRGYRHILIEAGHMGQNIYLLSSAFNLHCCAVGGFVDDELNQLLDIDGVNEAALYVLCVGK